MQHHGKLLKFLATEKTELARRTTHYFESKFNQIFYLPPVMKNKKHPKRNVILGKLLIVCDFGHLTKG